MKKILLTQLIAAVCVLPLISNAQTKEIVFGSSKKISGSKRKSESAQNAKNSLSTGFLSWLNGYQAVYYERALTSFLSVRVGGGVTFRSFGNDFGQVAFEDGASEGTIAYPYEFNGSLDYSLQDITDKYESYHGRSAKLGSYLAIAPRVYFSEVMNGFTIFPCLEYKIFRSAALLADESPFTNNSYSDYLDEANVPRTTQSMTEKMTCLDFTMNVGGAFQSASHLNFAWHVGFGVRSFKAVRQDLQYVESISNSADYYLNAVKDYKGVRPFLSTDFCIGGWF